jgi:eukaryotic-like serine/threonine-protein kinase
MDDPAAKQPGREGGTAGGGASAPAKGESSSGDFPRPEKKQPQSEPADIPGDANTLNDDVTFVDASATPAKARHSAVIAKRNQFGPGDVFGGRYEILQVLGEGGMGTVYKARDREVEHLVALKLIRPEMASHPVILARFRQELLTARQVTHRNAIRIYDMAEADGTKYITMEFVEGHDLRKLLHEGGKLPAEKAVEIVRQICHALDAAHSAGVIHRDLKPQNIMQEKSGRILVMDFGLARSLESDGMTQSGTLLGTIEYMSPEQAMGKQLDARSDLFTLGLIFYELLTGKIPYKADTAMASLLLRNQERAVPVAELDSSIPKGLSDIVSKCLERDLAQRYQSVQAILADLDAWQGKRPVSASVVTQSPQTVVVQVGGPNVPWKWIGVAVVAIALAGGGWLWNGKLGGKPVSNNAVSGPQVSLAILPFRNGSGDAKLDWLGGTVADTLSAEVGQSPQLRTISADRVRQILSDLRIPAGNDIDAASMTHIADFTSADTMVSGQYVKFGEQIQITATLRDLKRQRNTTLKAEAANEKALLPAMEQLAKDIQQNLSLSSDVLKELRAKSFRPSSNSLPALRNYNEGLELARQGNALEAQKKFESAAQVDGNFALAYSRLGQAYSTLRNDAKAQEYSQKAVDLSDKLPAPERYLIQANHAQVTNDYRKAIESYENLEKVSPDDADVRFRLGELYESTGAFDKARSELGKVLASDPKRVDALIAAGRVEIKGGNPQASLDFLFRGLAQAIQLNNLDGKATILNAMGAAYEQLNKPDDAMGNYKQALEIKRTLKQKAGEALVLGNIARVQASLGKPNDAYKSYNEAEKLQRAIGDKKGLGVTLINLGQLYTERSKYDDALKAFKESLQIHRDIGDEYRQALCLNNIGNVYLAKGQSSDALTYYEGALELRKKGNVPSEIGETLHNLGEASLKAGDYGKSLDYHLKALELFRNSGDKSGGAIQLYSMGIIFEYQGRYGAALKSKEEALKTYRELQDRGFWMGEILSGHGKTLSELGRYDEAQKSLTEAMSLAKELGNKTLTAQILNFQGDVFYYRGDLRQASELFAQAGAVSEGEIERETVLLTKYNSAKCAVGEKKGNAPLVQLRSVIQDAEGAGLKYIATEARLTLTEALLNTRQFAAAKTELQTARATSDKLGLQMLQARGQFLLGRAAEASGEGEDAAAPYYAAAKRALEVIRQESANDAILKRQDLAAIAAQPDKAN